MRWLAASAWPSMRVRQHGEGDLDRPRQRPVGGLCGRSHVDKLKLRFQAPQLGQLTDGEPGAGLGQLGPRGEHGSGVVQLACHWLMLGEAALFAGRLSEASSALAHAVKLLRAAQAPSALALGLIRSAVGPDAPWMWQPCAYNHVAATSMCPAHPARSRHFAMKRTRPRAPVAPLPSGNEMLL